MHKRSQKPEAGGRAPRAASTNVTGCAIIKLSRAQIVDSLEKGAQDRVGLSARVMLKRYRKGSLADPSRVGDLIALSNLLRKNDPILAE